MPLALPVLFLSGPCGPMTELTFQYFEDYVQANSAPTVQDSTLRFVLPGSGHQPENGFSIEAYLALAKPVAARVTPTNAAPAGPANFTPGRFQGLASLATRLGPSGAKCIGKSRCSTKARRCGLEKSAAGR